jgi:DUF1680 family protein
MRHLRTIAVAGGLMLLGLGATPARGGERALVDTAKSPDARMYMVDLGDAQWTGGLWGDRMAVCRTTMIPHLWELFQNEKASHVWANFLLAAGQDQGVVDRRHEGPPFDDGDFFKWFEALAQTYAVTHDPATDALMDRIIAVVAQAQRADGYFHTPTVIAERQGQAQVKEFANRNHFETYNMGHLMTAACVHYRATGKTTMLALARKAADYLYGFYQRASPELARNAICPSHYMGVVELYRATGTPRYLELAKQLIEIRDEVKDGTDQNQDRVPFRQMTRAAGHAVRANYLYAGVADVVAETGDQTLLRPLEAIGEDVVSHKLYLTGATGALYDGASPDGSDEFDEIQLVHQAYGRDFQLPNLTAYNESCATVGFVLWNWRMLLLTGDARYADLVEQSLYNGVLAAISLDGRDYFYVNPLRKRHDFGWPLRWSRQRQPNIQASFCCPPNIVRTIAEAQDYAYSLSQDTLWVNLYGASTLDTAWVDGGRIKLRQETDYPWNGAVKLTIAEAPARPIALRLRVPGWSHAGQTSIRVNGQPVAEMPRPGTYVEVKRTWQPGDVVQLDLNFEPVLLEANPLVEETLNQVAVKNGPLVYCLESNDLPAGVRLEDVALALTAGRDRFTARREKIAGAEIVALGVSALVLPRTPGDARRLYREVDPAPPREIRVTLIPYYAWDNRGDTEMTVWLPVR